MLGSKRCSPGGFAAAALLLGLATAAFGADEPTSSGRVRITPVTSPGGAALNSLSRAIEDRFTPAVGQRYADQRLISLRPDAEDPKLFDLTTYDYASESGFEIVLDARGNEVKKTPLLRQPDLAPDELQDAMAIVSASDLWRSGIKSGDYRLYAPMPPISTSPTGQRLINVGIQAPVGDSHALLDHEIVSVHIPSESITRYGGGAPATSIASSTLLACGPPSSSCGASGTCTTGATTYQIEWPMPNPVWKVHVRRPSCTSSVQSSGTGLELTDVYYQGKMVLKRAEVPVLNVLYAGNACGPFRDWLTSENCFQATGADIFPGMRVTTGNPAPATICESGSDSGDYDGVAIHDQGTSLWLLTETSAGWYRYIMEWRLHLDGTIEPIFGFAATSNNCVCNVHYHPAYWRIEWAIDAASDGTTDDPATGIVTLEHRQPGTLDQYDPVPTEQKFIRPGIDPGSDWFRVRNPQTGTGYLLEPGSGDGNAAGDPYGKGDLWALALNANQINDPDNPDTSIGVDAWVNGEALGASKRLVTWYHATYTHDIAGGDNEPCDLVGPKLVYLQGCAGTVAADKTIYACGGAVGLSVDDYDLRGAGTVPVTVSSAHEPAPETVVLNESPAGSGHFTGSIGTTTGPAVNGDGLLSIADGDTVTVRYVDASACGTPNVTVEKSAAIDCAGPAITNVRAVSITSTSASIAWDTNEPATSLVHYGTAPPGGSSASATALVTDHSLLLTGLSPCTLYYYWVESADQAGNALMTNSGGGYFAFITGSTGIPTGYTSTDTPIPIPDSSSATSTINVPDTYGVEDANVSLSIAHSYDSDLVLSLISPIGTTVTLSNRRGGSGDNYTGTIFDDEAATPISAGSPPFTGSFTPDSPLSAVDGQGAAGAWQLKATDMAAIDTGTINTWTLTLSHSGTCASLPLPPPVPDGTVGQAMTATRLVPDGSSLHLLWDTATCPASNYHLLYGTLATVGAHAPGGAVCGLGPAGAYDWSGAPSGDLWFLVASEDAAGKEGTWGTTSAGAPRGGTTASGLCGCTSRSNDASCP
jgi:subtilisin-like proprotein convertase family protein